MPGQLTSLTGTQKAACLLLAIGKDKAAKVMSTMTEAEVEEVAAEIVRMGTVPRALANTVVTEFYTAVHGAGNGPRGGADTARELLVGTVGKARANSILERVNSTPGSMPFAFLRNADGRQLYNFLVDEHPQTIALVVAHLRTDQAAAILAGLPEDMLAQVAHRIAKMDSTAPEYIHAVAEVLQRRTSSALAPSQQQATEVGGIEPLVEMINRADSATEKLILEGLTGIDEELAEEIRGQMFVFEDLLNLEDRAIQLILRSVESGVLAKALKGASEAVNNKILKNVSSRARESIVEEIELMGRMRMSEVEEARAVVVGFVRELEAKGEIVLRGGEEDEYVG